MRMGRTERPRLFIHQLRESFHAAGGVAREAARHIIGTLDEEGAEQLDSLIRFARLDV